jgi:hypothetical protein
MKAEGGKKKEPEAIATLVRYAEVLFLLFSYFCLHPSDFLCFGAGVFPEGFMR